MRLFLIPLFILIICFGFAQNRNKIDSVLRLEKTYPADTNSIKKYWKIAGYFKKNKPDSSYYFLDKAIAISLKLKNSEFYSKSQVEKFLTLKSIALPAVQIDSLFKLYNDPIITSYKKSFQSVCFELGIAYRKVSRYDKSFKYLQESLTLAEEIRDSVKIQNSYNSLANTLSQSGLSKGSIEDLEKAIKFYTKAFEYIDKNNNVVIGTILNNKGVAFFNIGSIKNDSSIILKAIKFYKDALVYRLKTEDSSAISDTYDNIASCYHFFSNAYNDTTYFEISKEYYEKAMAIDRLIYKDVDYIHYSNYGGHLAIMGKFRKNKKLLIKSIEILKTCFRKFIESDDTFQRMLTSLNIAQTYAAAGLNDSAVAYYDQHIALKDLILNAENKQVAEELAAKYESDLKDSENSNLKAQAELREEVISKKSNTIKLMVFASIIMVGLIMMVLISRQKINKSRALIKKQQIETERQKILVEEKQIEILSSINYAKRIQISLLPTEKYIKRIMDNKNKKV